MRIFLAPRVRIVFFSGFCFHPVHSCFDRFALISAHNPISSHKIIQSREGKTLPFAIRSSINVRSAVKGMLV